jgi:hypothetical protein
MAPSGSDSRPASRSAASLPFYPSGVTLPGPSKTIVVEPLEKPAEAPEPEPAEAPEPEKAPAK